MTVDVASQTAYVTLRTPGLNVASQTTYVVMRPGRRLTVSSQTVYVAIKPAPPATPTRPRAGRMRLGIGL